MIAKSIKVNVQVAGLHFWEDATNYLSFPHRHMFKITCYAQVQGSDREIEFHDLIHRTHAVLAELYPTKEGQIDFGEKSCEQIAEEILIECPQLYRVEVSEDGECSASVLRTEKRKTLTVCGSTSFKKEFEEALLYLEHRGIIALSVGGFTNADKIQILASEKRDFDKLHKDKIATSDGIFVVNPGGYVGESTASKIAFAHSLGKEIYSMFPQDFGNGVCGMSLDTPRKEVAVFAQMMERKLKAKDHKGGWSNRAIQDLLSRLRGEIEELQSCVDENSIIGILDETVDVANFAMMIADKVRGERDANNLMDRSKRVDFP
jgi:hypothetical protein